MASAGMESGPAALWLDILLIAALNSSRVSFEDAERDVGMLDVGLVFSLGVSEKFSLRKRNQISAASVADSIILPDASVVRFCGGGLRFPG